MLMKLYLFSKLDNKELTIKLLFPQHRTTHLSTFINSFAYSFYITYQIP
jgi:hypothetical protein